MLTEDLLTVQSFFDLLKPVKASGGLLVCVWGGIHVFLIHFKACCYLLTRLYATGFRLSPLKSAHA